MAVWGQSYTNLFLELSLPSQLAPGNIPALARQCVVVYYIYTTAADADTIRKHSARAKLAEHVTVEIICDDACIAADKFAPLIAFHNRSIIRAAESHAALLFLAPDFVLADGGMRRIVELHEGGKRAIFTLTPRMLREQSQPELAAAFDAATQSIALPPRTLAGLSFQYLHPIEQSYFWGDAFSSFPIHAYWRSGGEGIIAHCFYLHPIFVDPEVTGVMPVLTIDADFVDLCCPNRDAVYVVQDSDEFFCVELSVGGMGDANATQASWAATVWGYANWGRVHANPVYASTLHHWLFGRQVCLHNCGREGLDRAIMARAWCVAWRVSALIRLGRIGRRWKEAAARVLSVPQRLWGRCKGLTSDPVVLLLLKAPPGLLRSLVRMARKLPGVDRAVDRLRLRLLLSFPPSPDLAAACFSFAEGLRRQPRGIDAGPLDESVVLGAGSAQFITLCATSCGALLSGWDATRMRQEEPRWADLASRRPESLGAQYLHSLLLLHTGRRREGLREMARRVRAQTSSAEKACWVYAHLCLVRLGKASSTRLVGLRRVLALMETSGIYTGSDVSPGGHA